MHADAKFLWSLMTYLISFHFCFPNTAYANASHYNFRQTFLGIITAAACSPRRAHKHYAATTRLTFSPISCFHGWPHFTWASLVVDKSYHLLHEPRSRNSFDAALRCWYWRNWFCSINMPLTLTHTSPTPQLATVAPRAAHLLHSNATGSPTRDEKKSPPYIVERLHQILCHAGPHAYAAPLASYTTMPFAAD
jgi:hypothetical protein